jgi:hypothetical protein
MPSTIVDNPGANKTISEAERAASVHPATAIPTLAFLSAGASLTPSPLLKKKKLFNRFEHKKFYY